MKKRRLFLIAACLWLLFIWGNSFVPSKQSAKVSAQITHAVAPELKGNDVYLKAAEIRDFAHVAEFALLSGLVILGLDAGKRFWHRGLVTAAACAAVAGLDETIQYFIPGRTARAADVMQDLWGVLLGIAAAELFLLLLNAFYKKRHRN